MEKTANQLWKEYRKKGGQLSFKQWIDLKNSASHNFTTAPAKPITDTLQKEIDVLHRTAGFQDRLNKDYILGIPKTAFFMSLGIVAIGTAVYFVYKK